jgi:DNA polymerase-3 subunit gamma/tau
MGISGRPLSEIMAATTKGAAGATPLPADENPAGRQTPQDPEAQEKIERHREKFMARLASGSPRIAAVYETMEVEGNTLKVRVVSEGLREDVLRDKTETMRLLATVAGVHGPIELTVTVDESVRPAKPIRIEDKIRHMADLNPGFNTLRRTFELE